jgi:predicted MFS family arabinose efflux permease
MIGADLVRAAHLAGTAAVAFVDGPAAIVYTLITCASVVSTAFRPAQGAILPSLARSPDELTASNVASSTIESVSAFAGPALGGVLLAATSPGACFAAGSATFLWSALLLAGIGAGQAPDSEEERPPPKPRGFVREASAGAAAILHDRTLRVLVGLFTAQVLVSGALFVYLVPVAFDLLDVGERGFGVLLSALGAGGVLGAIVAVGLVGRRLSTAFAIGVVLWGAPIALIPAWPEQAGVLVLVGVVGLANTVVDVCAYTLLQRAVPDDVLARVFGILESLAYGGAALGAIVAVPLSDWLGLDGALVATGAFLPALVALSWRSLVRIDAQARVPARELELLRGVPFLAVLPGPTLEELALRLTPMQVAAGEVVFRQGDAGDRFYLIAQGTAAVAVDGQAAPQLGPAGYFGEIALLRDVPRTATVTALTDLSLLALERDVFIAAVTGHAPSAEAAGAVVAARLAVRRPGLGPI